VSPTASFEAQMVNRAHLSVVTSRNEASEKGPQSVKFVFEKLE